MVKKVVKTLRCFIDSYQAQKERLTKQERYPPWDFPSAVAFSRFSQFMNHMLQLEVTVHFVFFVFKFCSHFYVNYFLFISL